MIARTTAPSAQTGGCRLPVAGIRTDNRPTTMASGTSICGTGSRRPRSDHSGGDACLYGWPWPPTVSWDGRIVAFGSAAADLSPATRTAQTTSYRDRQVSDHSVSAMATAAPVHRQRRYRAVGRLRGGYPGHGLQWAWSDNGAGGVCSPAQPSRSTWMAPGNASGTISVGPSRFTVTCSQGSTASGWSERGGASGPVEAPSPQSPPIRPPGERLGRDYTAGAAAPNLGLRPTLVALCGGPGRLPTRTRIYNGTMDADKSVTPTSRWPPARADAGQPERQRHQAGRRPSPRLGGRGTGYCIYLWNVTSSTGATSAGTTPTEVGAPAGQGNGAIMASTLTAGNTYAW